MKFPDKLDVLIIHATIIADTGGTSGLRDEGAFESALAAAENRQHYEDVDVVSCAATYAYHLTQTKRWSIYLLRLLPVGSHAMK